MDEVIMAQFLISKSDIQDNLATLSGEEAKHARDVMRLKPGDAIHLFDGVGQGFAGKIVTASKKAH